MIYFIRVNIIGAYYYRAHQIKYNLNSSIANELNMNFNILILIKYVC